MAFHTSIAAPQRRFLAAAALALLLGGVSVPAGATEQVYIWRDASGQLRFDAVQKAAARHQSAAEAHAAAPAADRGPASIVLTGTTQSSR